MSYDRKLEFLCPHLVVDEYLVVKGLRNRVFPMRPIASSASIVARVNGFIEVPSFGVDLPASSKGSKEGPFTIVSGVSDTLRLRVGGGSWQTVVVPSGIKKSVSSICSYLSSNFSGVQFYSVGELVGFQTAQIGKDATVFIHSASTLATLLGIPLNREYRGKRAFPGWSVVSAPYSVGDRHRSMLIFDEPLPAESNFVELNYTTVQSECRRCGGVGVENDWRYNNNGSLQLVKDEELLIQELKKIIFSTRGSNPFHPWYGTVILDQIGQKILTGSVLQNRIVADIQTTFSRWQSIKKQQEESVGQPVTDREFPFALQSVTIEQSQQDPTIFFVNLVIRNRSFQTIPFSRGIRIPQPEDLLGSTQHESIVKGLRNY
jgi:hypothetical protein